MKSRATTSSQRLLQAVLAGDLRAVRTSLSAGDEVDVRDANGRTPLMLATIDGRLEIVKVLVEHGADADAHDTAGYTPLHFAAQEFVLPVIVALLDAGAVVDARDAHGNTPLGRAVFASRGRGDVIKLLLARGADRNLRNNRGTSPIQLARTIANYDILPFFG